MKGVGERARAIRAASGRPSTLAAPHTQAPRTHPVWCFRHRDLSLRLLQVREPIAYPTAGIASSSSAASGVVEEEEEEDAPIETDENCIFDIKFDTGQTQTPADSLPALRTHPHRRAIAIRGIVLSPGGSMVSDE